MFSWSLVDAEHGTELIRSLHFFSELTSHDGAMLIFIPNQIGSQLGSTHVAFPHRSSQQILQQISR